MRAIFFKCLYLFLLTTAMLSAPAQTAATGTIAGQITDTSGAALPGAVVVIRDTDTGAVHNVVTNSDGVFSVAFLQSGHYEVVASAAGFAQLDHKNLKLTVGQLLTVDSSLPTATISTDVIVTSADPLIDTQKVQVSQTVTQEYVANLPVNGRRWDNFVLLTPNVAPDSNSGLISYRGVSGLYNSNLVDGVSNQQALFAEARGRATGAPYVFSPDSIKEFQSAVSGYSSEFGGAAGGQVNAISKSGDNALHGDLFYYLRYPSLNALDPYSKWQALHAGGLPALLTQTVHQQQQFGGSVGGPVIKDKLFYFFTYDGFRKASEALYATTTPSATLASYATSPLSCPSPLSATQCQNAVNFLLSQQGAFGRNVKQDIFFPKLDFQLDEKDHISTSFLWQDYKQPNAYASAVSFNNSGVGTNGTLNFHERFYIASWERVLNANTANSLKFQWSRDLETAGANAAGPNVSITNVASYGEATGVPRAAEPDEHRWQVVDVLSQTHGHHSLKAGVDLNFVHMVMINLFTGDGAYSYSAASSGTPYTAFGEWVQDVYGVNGGRHYTSFTQVVDPITHVGKDDFWNKNLSGFIEDSWKALPSLTFTAGLRYDLQLVPQPPMPYVKSVSGTSSPLGASVTSVIHTNYKMFQPRIGFAYNPYPGTVIRGGYGIFTGLIPLSTYYALRVENGVYQGQYSFRTSTPGVAASYALGAPSNMNVLFTPPGPALAAPFAGATTPSPIGLPACPGNCAAVSLHGLDPKFTQPYTHSVDLSVEQLMTPTTTLTVGYVGTRGMRLPYAIDVNQPAFTGATRTYDVVNATGVNSGQPVTVPFYPGGAAPSPADGSISVAYSGLNTWYNALSVSIKQQMKYGFQALINYTWAHTQDAGQVGGSNGAFYGTDIILDPFNRKGIYSNPNINMSREQANSDIDMRERFVASLVYAPTYHLTNSFARHAANGWTLAGTATEQTGFPVTALMSSNPPSGRYATATGAIASAAGFDGSATGAGDNLGNVPGNAYGRAPNVKRNGFVGPGLRNVDMRIARDFQIHEGLRFQLLGEAFNVVNHRNGLAVATTAYAYVAPSATSTTCPSGSHVNTCIVPYAATTSTSTPFGTINTTSSTLYGPRQLQFSAKIFF